jgi:4-hydroxy-tetrahydrodipicolinate reductase
MTEMRIVIAGASGRMGRVLVKCVHEMDGVMLAGAIGHSGSIALGEDAGLLAGCGSMGVKITDDAVSVIANADGILDFTSPQATVEIAALAAQARAVHVIGTTGLQADDLAKIDAAARHAVIVQSGNMSLGVNLIAGLAAKAAKILGADYDIEIVEMHHKMKIDSPSGTALLLGEAAARGRGIDLNEHSVRGRDGQMGARQQGDIGFASLRGGTVVGDHTIVFAGPGERIELTHKAEDRSIFARGAVQAALWGKGRKPGLYSMKDVLGLEA